MDEYQDSQDTDDDSSQDSPVITKLRKDNRLLEKELEQFRKAQEEAEAAAQQQRTETVQEIVNSLGFPGLAEDVSGWVEGAVTAETVQAALEARSIIKPDGDQPNVQPTPETKPAPSASDVGQRVADAAGGIDRRSLDERLAAAESAAEVESLMDEAKLVRKHY